jgi:hypothetical protein
VTAAIASSVAAQTGALIEEPQAGVTVQVGAATDPQVFDEVVQPDAAALDSEAINYAEVVDNIIGALQMSDYPHETAGEDDVLKVLLHPEVLAEMQRRADAFAIASQEIPL